MAQETKFEKEMPAIYKRKMHHHIMLGWVRGQRRLVSGLSIEKAIEGFMDEYKLTEEDFPLRTAMVIYNRMQKEELEAQKTKR